LFLRSKIGCPGTRIDDAVSVTSKRRNWLFVVAGVVMACMIALVVAAEMVIRLDQPYYQGRSYSDWLAGYEYELTIARIAGQTNNTSYLALRAIGTNALPCLMRWVSHDRSSWSIKLESLVAKLPPSLAKRSFFQRLAAIDRRPEMPHRGFQLLGQDARSAVPELIRLMRAPNADKEGYTAALALACIGPAGCAPLLEAAADSHAPCRAAAFLALGQMGTNAVPALPFLLESLGDMQLCARSAGTLDLLGFNGGFQKEAIPALRAALDSPHEQTRLYAASVLARMGAELDRALPVLDSAPPLPPALMEGESLTNAPPQ
jgi:hypothetical protein